MKRLLLLTAVALALFSGTAHADPDPASVAADPAPPSAADLSAAQAAVAKSRTTLGRFFGAKGGPASDATISSRLADRPVPVYDLNPAFVAGQAPQIARFAFLSTRARAADGQLASVWTTRTPSGGWTVSNIASGDDEHKYGSQPGTVFREPQLNAWYALRDGMVVPLNGEATSSVGAAGLPVADYQRLVHERYAAKLPGSSYAAEGYAGGYGAPTPDGPAPSWPLWLAAGATALALMTAGGFALRRGTR
ncbi:hypothetical protein ACIBG7_05525 [Nonomuraea sp. NPDC050328]|uniref:hypothetical protein n=1 Tax=Nonomuraea sp. NPDC050328 TaxID=3364361 RepID=UPI003794CA3F